MSASPIDSTIFGKLFGDTEVGQLFTDTAHLRAMMLVEGSLAKAQGQLGLIPEISAHAIHRASLELQLDPAALADATAQSGVPVPAFVVQFRDAMHAPEHSQYVHWGATSQDVIDTALTLRLRQALNIIETILLSRSTRWPIWPRHTPTCPWPRAPGARTPFRPALVLSPPGGVVRFCAPTKTSS